jgi:hypothetical protein
MIAVNLVDPRSLMRIMYLFRLTRIMIRTFQERVAQHIGGREGGGASLRHGLTD